MSGPLSGASAAAAAGGSPTVSSIRFASASDIADKYTRKPATPAAAATQHVDTSADDEVDPFARRSVSSKPPPKFGLVRPSISVPASAPSQVMHSSELDESTDSIDPGSQSGRRAQPGALTSPTKKTLDDSSFFNETPFQAIRAPVNQPTSPAQQMRYSYLDTKDPTKQKHRPTTESNPSSDEESPFTRAVKPLIGPHSIWNKSIDPPPQRNKPDPAHSSHLSRVSEENAPAVPPYTPRSRPSSLAVDDSRSKSAARMASPPALPPIAPPSQAAAVAAASPASPAQPSMDQSLSATMTAGASFHGQGDLSREFHQLQQEWSKQEAESRAKSAAAPAQRVLRPSAAQSSPRAATATGPNQSDANEEHQQPTIPSPNVSSISASLDALGALQNQQSRANQQATRDFLLNDSYYAPSIELHEVLADHKRLRQRLRAAQHAIEALAAGSEPGAVDGAASLAAQIGGSASSVTNIISPAGKARRGYQPALQSPPSSLSMSQYAHLPPARAVLKLLHRLEVEEESFQHARESWRSERTRLGSQLSTLTADLRHLTSLAQQAHSNDAFFRRREVEHANEIERIKSEHALEQTRWKEVEKDLRDAGLRERIRFNADISKLERNDSYYKEKYDAVLTILRKYEAERKQGGVAPLTERIDQQEKLFQILQQETELEKQSLLSQLQSQEARFAELQATLTKMNAQQDAQLQTLRDQVADERRKRNDVERDLLNLQQGVTRNLDEKLSALQSLQNGVAPQVNPAQVRDQERRRAFEREREEHIRAYDAHRNGFVYDRPEYVRARGGGRGRSRSRPRSRYDESPSERSCSPIDRRHVARAHFHPGRVASAQSILAMLPADAQVHGDIEFVLPDDGSPPFYEASPPLTDRSDRRIDDARYARPTFSSDHAAAIAERRHAPTRSRSRSDSRSPRRSGIRSRSRDRVRCEADRRIRYQPPVVSEEDFSTPAAAARRSRSHSRTAQHRARTATAAPTDRVGPAVNGHTGVTIRVSKKVAPPTRVSAATKASTSKKAARQAYHAAYDEYEYDRYGRVTDARYI